MRAVLVGAYIIQSHFLFSASSLSLEKDSFSMSALWARVLFRSWQRRITDDIGNNVRQFVNFVHNFVNVDTVTFSFGLVIAVPASVQKNLIVLVLFRIQHVVAFLTKLDTDEA